MNVDQIIDSLGRLEPEVLQSVEALRQTETPKERYMRRPFKRFWLPLTACLCLTILIVFPFARGYFSPRGGPDDSPKEFAMLEYNGLYYQPIDNPKILVRYGLPEQITAELAGDHVSYLKLGEILDYEETADPTDIQLYEYAPAPCRGVYILRDGDHYFGALFSGFHQFDTNTHVELADLYRVFYVSSAASIASITEMDQNQEFPLDDPVTDPTQLEAFFHITTGMTEFSQDETVITGLPSFGNDDFQSLMFGDLSKEQQKDLHLSLAEDLRVLRIQTTDGLNFFLNLYPSYDWIYGVRAHSYYQMNEMMKEWIRENLN